VGRGRQHPGLLTVDIGPGGRTANRIPGASGNDPNNPGAADIIFWGKDQVFIWEVKPGNAYGRTEGPVDLNRYVTNLQQHHAQTGDTRPVLPGPAMPRDAAVPSAVGPIDVWSEGAGMRYYGRTRTPTPTPRPIPVPVPEPVPERVPRTVPQPQPQPSPQPQQQPDDGGFRLPGWVKPVAGGVVVVGGAALIVGTIGEDVVTGGVGIADDPLTIGGGLATIRSGWALAFG
jgi:hypothetical protein